MKKKLTVIGVAACVVALTAALAACAPQATNSSDSASKDDTTEQAVEAVEADQTSGEVNVTPATDKTPEADQYGVITAESWSEVYPNEYATYMENLENSPQSEDYPDGNKHNYLELYPALNTMYKGYAFALGYDEAASHLYTLYSVSHTPRTIEKDQAASCITCKTPQFTATVNKDGDGVYKEAFWDVFNDLEANGAEPVSCYNCHENDPTSNAVPAKYWQTSMGADLDSSSVPKSAVSCGQCHNEYYFAPETKVTSNPYSGLAEMTPDAILKYYDDMDFTDWTYPDTDAKMIKVQHPEFETNYGGTMSPMAKLGYSCADCHMGTVTEDGVTFTDHNWTSPLENQELVEAKCTTSCHGGSFDAFKTEITDIQAKEEDRVISISEKIEDFINKFVENKASMSDEDIATAQKLQREMQFYWDFVMVENSEGAHNPQLTWDTLDQAEAKADEGLAMFA